jgi:hypothetical protein
MLNQGFLFKDFKKFVQQHSETIKNWAIQTAEKANRPFTRMQGRMRKDDEAAGSGPGALGAGGVYAASRN